MPDQSPLESQAAWDQARAIVDRHIAEHEQWLVKTTPEPQPGAPFLFVMRPGGYPLLVHHGAVLTTPGLDALRGYLDESGVITGHALTVATFRILLDVFRITPPLAGQDAKRAEVRLGAAPTALAPQLVYRDGGAELSLFYLGGIGGADRSRIPVAEWILLVQPGQGLLWTRRGRLFDHSANRLLDVDHP